MHIFKFLLISIITLLFTAELAYSVDMCSVDVNSSHSFPTDGDIYTVPPLHLLSGSHHQYYFNVTTAGTLTITATSSQDKVRVAYSDTACPVAVSANPTTLTVKITNPADINVDLIATAERDYTFTVRFVPSPLAITKTNSPLLMGINTSTNVLYTFSVHNYGALPLSNVHVTDTLPTGVTFSNLNNISATGWDCSASSTPSSINCTLATLATNATKEIIVSTTAFKATTGNIINTAIATADGGWSVSDPSTLAAISAAGTVDLEIQKFASNDVILPGTAFAYLIFVINYNSAEAQLVKVTDIFPADDNVSFDSAGGNGWSCTAPTAVNRTFECNYDRPLGKGITYFIVNAHAGDNNATNVRNYASVSTLNPNNNNHNMIDYADISISPDGSTGNSYFTGVYPQGGAIEVSDLGISNRNNAKIWTKIAAKTNMTFPVYYVNPSGAVMDYNGTNGSVPLTIIFKLTDDTCSVANETYLGYDSTKSVIARFAYNSGPVVYAKTDPDTTFHLRNIAKKKSRLLVKYLNIQGLLDISGEACSNSNLSSNIKGLPQCIADSIGSSLDNNKYINVFGLAAFARCAIDNGQPCGPSHHGAGDAPYDSPYGCYECTIGGSGYCSKDNFAIRPNDFNSTITANQFFIAEQGTPITFRADQFGGIGTIDYNESEPNSFVADLNMSDSSKICATTSLQFNPNIVFSNGLVTNNYTLTNVGDFNLTVHEINGSEYAFVDRVDTPDIDRFITPHRTQIKVIPDHFALDANLTNATNGFTYFSNFEAHPDVSSRNMSASLEMNITAQGASNSVLSNYTSLCYAEDGNITLTLNDTLDVDPANSLTKLLWYDNLHDLNGSVLLATGATIYAMDINKSQFDNPDSNGTATVKYLINFDRNQTLVTNPLFLSVHDINVTDVTGAQGSTTLEQNATFYYGRVHAPDYRFEVITDTANVFHEIYSTQSKTVRNGMGITGNEGADSINWYNNVLHVDHTSGEYNTSNVFSQSNTNITNPILKSMDLTSPRLPHKDKITMTPNFWLVYDRFNNVATTSDFLVEFEKDGFWAGAGNLGKTIDLNISKIQNRNLDW